MLVHVSLLGEQSITEGPAGSIRTRSSRTVALVAYLVLHAGSPQTRQRIAGLFWPDSTDAQALTNLRRELHGLRRVLRGAPSLVVTAKDLCWRETDDVRVDVLAFDGEHRAARAALKAGDTEKTSNTPTPLSPSTPGSSFLVCTTIGFWTPGRSCSADVWTCAP